MADIDKFLAAASIANIDTAAEVLKSDILANTENIG